MDQFRLHIGDEVHRRDGLNGKLGFWVEGSNAIDLIAKEIEAVRVFRRIRKDV